MQHQEIEGRVVFLRQHTEFWQFSIVHSLTLPWPKKGHSRNILFFEPTIIVKPLVNNYNNKFCSLLDNFLIYSLYLKKK